MIEVLLQNLDFIFVSILSFSSGWVMKEDAKRRQAAMSDLPHGHPHFLLTFGILGWKIHPDFDNHPTVGWIFPRLGIVENWTRILGHFWVRISWRDLTEEEEIRIQVQQFEAYNAKMDEQRRALEAQSRMAAQPKNDQDRSGLGS